MVTGMRLPFHRSSGYVVQRAGLKLAFLLVVAAVEQAFGWDNAVGQLSSFARDCALFSRPATATDRQRLT